MRSPFTLFMLLAIGLMLCQTIVGCGATHHQPPAGMLDSRRIDHEFQKREAIEASHAAIMNATTIQVDVTMRLSSLTRDGNRRTTLVHKGELSMKQPNLLRINMQSNSFHDMIASLYPEGEAPRMISAYLSSSRSARSVNIRSDGNELHFYSPFRQSFFRTDAPETNDDLLERLYQYDDVRMIKQIARTFRVLRGDQNDPVSIGLASRGNIPDEIREANLENATSLIASRDVDDDEYRSWHTLWVLDGDLPLPALHSVMSNVPRTEQQMRGRLLQRFGVEDGDDSYQDFRNVIARLAELEFSNWRIDEPIPDEQFRFDPSDSYEMAASLDELHIPSTEHATPRVTPFDLVGERMPDVHFHHLNEQAISLHDQADATVILLDFWATWCRPCILAMPGLMEIEEEYAERGLRFYAVNLSERREVIEQFLSERDWELDVLMDPDGEATTSFNIATLPTTIIIDHHGIIRTVHQGYSPALKEKLRAELDAVLGGQYE